MGLSVSAAAGIVIIGVILIFGTLYPAIESSRQMKNEARSEWAQRQDAEQRAAMTITSIDLNQTEERLNISLKNTGDTALNLEELEILINGVYMSEKISDWVVEEEITNTNIWNPCQHLNLTLQNIEEDSIQRVVVVDEFGSETYYGESEVE